MITSKPTYNIVMPLNIADILVSQSETFITKLKEVMATVTVTSLRLRTSSLNKSQLIEAVTFIQAINAREVPLLIENNLELAVKLKVDGVHLTNGQKLVKEAREMLGESRIIGSFCGNSKHSGLVAAEHGANYVAFHAEKNTALENQSALELFKWWSEFIEIPVMAECLGDSQITKQVSGCCDFLSLDFNMWKPGAVSI
jgi:thiamine-phosphate pyrophosphorylase